MELLPSTTPAKPSEVDFTFPQLRKIQSTSLFPAKQQLGVAAENQEV